MKKILALAAVAALTAGVSAYAANPFSDVSTDDWAYQAVSDLSVQGVVEGYPDGTFKGERNMTRYELAQIVARMLAKEDQLNAEQKATLDKLAAEFADELSNLGVRVSNLEKKVGNLYWSGDARMRYAQNTSVKSGEKKAEKWTGRIRINVKGQVNDSTYVFGRLNTGNVDWKKGSDANVKMDLLYVHHQFGEKVGVELGRYYVGIGNNDEIYGDAMDGVKVAYKNGAFGAEAGYGEFQAAKTGEYDELLSGTESAFYAKAGYNAPKFGLTLNYITTSAAEGSTADAKAKKEGIRMWGVDVNGKLSKDVKAYASYFKETEQDKDPAYWYAGLQYGQANRSKPGTFNIGFQYNSVDHGSVLGPTGFWNAIPYTSADANKDDVTFWSLLGDVTLQKNVTLHAEYAFNIDGDKADYRDAYAVSLNYKF